MSRVLIGWMLTLCCTTALGQTAAKTQASSALAQQHLQPQAQPQAQHPAQPVAHLNARALPLDELHNFTSVFEHIRRGYVDDISDAKLIDNAIRGMVSELDPFSAFLDKDAYAEVKAMTQGEFAGVGLEVSVEDGLLKIITPIDDSPSARAGLHTGDIIVRVNDEPVKSVDVNAAVRKLRGPKGSLIKLTILREGAEQPLDFMLERDIIKVVSVRSRHFDNYFYVRISQFQSNTGTELAQMLRLSLEKNPSLQGLIVDLRNNPGGLLQAAVEVADAFLDGGRVVFTRGRLSTSNVTYNAAAGDLLQGLPMVILVNSGSASASEIVAGALQDHKRAIIMGTKSFGKGSVQSVIPVGADSAIKLTTARYYTPNGRLIQDTGITPDVIVERKIPAAIEPPDDDQPAKPKRLTRAQLLQEDNQLNEALNLLKGLAIYREQQQSSSAAPSAPTQVSQDALKQLLDADTTEVTIDVLAGAQ